MIITNLTPILYHYSVTPSFTWGTFAWGWSSTPYKLRRIHITYERSHLHNHQDGQEIQSSTEAIRSMIISAILETGASSSDIQSIVFKPGKLIVTIDGSGAFLSAPPEEDTDDILLDDGLLLDDEDNVWLDNNEDQMLEDQLDMESDDIESMEEEEEDDHVSQETNILAKNDITTIARAINAALELGGVGSLGYDFASRNEIEVTTPGASNILSGVMFQSYRGFDVQVYLLDQESENSRTRLKKRQSSTMMEGKLIEKTNEHVVLNQKGRIKKIHNELIDYVSLPKSKKE
jgi:hypothetical protein